MAYQTLYRKYRPQTFDEVKGQDAIVRVLKNQINNNRLSHAYLFVGTRGTGKTSIAKLFARAINCENPKDGSPCNECASCKAALNGTSMNVIEMDAASNNGVDHVRRIIDEIAYSPVSGKYFVYIVDEVHMFSPNAFNALLKTLEEPPSYVIFILATTEIESIPITVLSRCQRYDFRRIDIATMVGRMRHITDSEGIEIDDRALSYIATCGEGSMRDSLSLLDRCVTFYDGKRISYDDALEVLGSVDTAVYASMLGHIMNSDVTGAINLLQEAMMRGGELTYFVSDFVMYLRNLMLVQVTDDIENTVNMSSDNIAILKEAAQNISPETVMRYIRVFSELSRDMNYTPQKQVLAEMAIVRVCTPDMEEPDLGSFGERISNLEEKVKNGIKAAPVMYVPAPQTVAPSSVPAGAPSVSGAPASPGSPAPAPDEKPQVLLPALPGEIQAVVDNWKVIREQLKETDLLLFNQIRKARVSAENDLLVIVFNSEIPYNIACSDISKDSLNEVFEKTLGSKVRFEMRLLKPEQTYSDGGYADILANINFEVEEV